MLQFVILVALVLSTHGNLKFLNIISKPNLFNNLHDII
jgi:hypothetical protein